MCIICDRGNEPIHEMYTVTAHDDFRWMTTANQSRGKRCDLCHRRLRPYPTYLGDKYEIARSSGQAMGFTSNSRLMTSKAFHADFGCHRFDLKPIKQSLFINHFKGKAERIINGLEVLRDVAAPESAEWIEPLISSDDYFDLLMGPWENKARAIHDEILENLSYQPNTCLGIEVGCIVEIVTGAFKGEKARVTSVEETDIQEVSMDLYEQPIPMTIKMRGDHIRVIERVE